MRPTATISEVTFQERQPPEGYRGIATTTSEECATMLRYRYFWESAWADAPGTFKTYWDYLME